MTGHVTPLRSGREMRIEPVALDTPAIVPSPLRRLAGFRRELDPKELAEVRGKVGWNRRGSKAGLYQEDPNPCLRPYAARGLNAAHGVWKKMRATDGTMAGITGAVELPILGATPIIQTRSNATDEEKLHRDFLWHCCERLRGGLDWLLERAVRAGQYGFRIFEIELAVDDTPWGPKWVPVALHDRLPWSIKEWIWDDKADEPVAFVQTGGQVVPLGHCLMFNVNSADYGLEGCSDYRPSHFPWELKQRLLLADAGIMEKWGYGVPIASALDERADGPNYARMQDMIRNFISDLRAGLVIPPAWAFRVDFPAHGITSPTERVQLYNTEMLLSYLATFLVHGSTDTGTRNVTIEHIKFFLQAEQRRARNIGEVVTHGNVVGAGLFDLLIEVNFTTAADHVLPWLELTGIDQRNLSEMAQILGVLAGSGFIDASDDLLREQVWEMFKLVHGDASETSSEPEVPEVEPEVERGEIPDTEQLVMQPTCGCGCGGMQDPVIVVQGRDGKDFLARRQLTIPERHVALATITETLETAGTDFRSKIEPALRGVQNDYLTLVKAQQVKDGLKNVDELVKAAQNDLYERHYPRVYQVFETHYQGLADVGTREGTAESREIYRRKKGISPKAGERHAKEGIGTVNAEQLVKSWAQQGADSMLTRWISTLSARVIGSASTGRIDELSRVKWADSTFTEYGAAGASQVLETARQSVIERTSDELEKPAMAYYTAIMDANLCEVCGDTEAILEGGVEVGSAMYQHNRPPNPGCLGGSRCRCIYVYETID